MASFKQLVNDYVYPRMEELCDQFYEEKENMVLDGEKAFFVGEPFLPGTLVASFCYLLVAQVQNTLKYDLLLARTQDIIQTHGTMPLNTFGIYEFLNGLALLRKNGIKDEVVSQEVDKQLQDKLHWNVFYDVDKKCLKKGLPTNYYGVAFRVAVLREYLGWEEEGMSTYFLEVLEDHIRTYSGSTLYMDETAGEGRYDKYTLTIASEICEAFLYVGKDVPPFWHTMMVHTGQIVLELADERALGFSYGRSIGAHGTACIIENIPVALHLGGIEKVDFAYSYCVRAARQVIAYWYSTKRGIINLWDDGRRTDHYRNKTRVLEVNLDMNLKLFRANHLLETLNLNNQEEIDDMAYTTTLETLPKFKYYSFEQKSDNRGMVIYRLKDNVFTLPIINGGKSYYKAMPYLPIPFNTELIQGTPEASRPMLVPKVTLEDGTHLMPISYMQNIKVETLENTYVVEWEQTHLCNIEDAQSPKQYEHASSKTRYTFSKEGIECTYVITSKQPIQSAQMVFETYEMDYEQKEKSLYLKYKYPLNFEVKGLGYKGVQTLQAGGAYDTPYGPLAHQWMWEQVCAPHCYKLSISWKMDCKDC